MSKIGAWLKKAEGHPRLSKYMQFIKFGLVGVSNTLISLAVYQFGLHVLKMYYQWANILSFVVSVTNAYYWNSRFVFKSGGNYTLKQHLAAYSKAFLSYGSTFLLSTALLTLWVEVVSISQSIAPVINLLITIPLNFVLNKFWAFKGGKAKEDSTNEDQGR